MTRMFDNYQVCFTLVIKRVAIFQAGFADYELAFMIVSMYPRIGNVKSCSKLSILDPYSNKTDTARRSILLHALLQNG